MRTALTILLLAAIPAPLLACEGFEHDMDALEHQVGNQSGKPETARFAREFKTADELQKWTETSTFGGGRTEKASFEGRDFIFAYRSYTSGVKSSDAAVYLQDGDEWRLVKAYPVLMNHWIVAEQGPEGIVFHPEGEDKSLMTLTPGDVAQF